MSTNRIRESEASARNANGRGYKHVLERKVRAGISRRWLAKVPHPRMPWMPTKGGKKRANYVKKCFPYDAAGSRSCDIWIEETLAVAAKNAAKEERQELGVGLTVSDVIDLYIKRCKSEYADEYKKTLTKHVTKVIGHRPAESIGAREINEEVFPKMEARRLSVDTARHVRVLIHKVFAFAKKRKHVPTLGWWEDVDKVEELRLKKPDSRPREMPNEEEFSLFVYDERVPLWLRTYAVVCDDLGGARRSDARKARWEHFSADLRFVDLHRSKTDEVQKLEVPDLVRQFLAEYHLQQGRPKSGPLFSWKRASSDARSLRYWLKKIGLKRHELHNDVPGKSRRASWHGWRHGYCTRLAVSGVNAQTAMALAGHSSMATHARYCDLAGVPLARPEAAARKIQRG